MLTLYLPTWYAGIERSYAHDSGFHLLVHDSSNEDTEEKTNEIPVENSASNRAVGGIVANDYGTGTGEAVQDSDEKEDSAAVPQNFSNSWKLNFVLAAASCWFAMALTGWGSIQTSGDVADPLVGQISMWIIVVSQWFILSLYLWTLVAPRLFPGRDFS